MALPSPELVAAGVGGMAPMAAVVVAGMIQGEFDWEAQQENLERVSSRIGAAILSFCGDHRRFHAEELREFVIRETGISAPASADRILRDLRQRGVIEYRVIDRRGSLYEVIAVREYAKANDQVE